MKIEPNKFIKQNNDQIEKEIIDELNKVSLSLSEKKWLIKKCIKLNRKITDYFLKLGVK